ncbi:DotA/TraY family protein [Sulfitobacter sp. R18_1]|uniref:DotA/TraY family protein n=1 Tax=Sulfitobacter sp. R18_1 TaxID=2821104 RepID=UPI001ADB0B72|nr:DotA/TraY family protein [Sulfitobacter sp. R18_1]MBO9428759.1 DotA/TraY family protein [Sulfitobacter sp. R18_1]
MSEEKKFNVKSEATSIVKDDFLGADEWKKSKVGYITGVSGIASGVRKVGSLGAGSIKRTASAAKWLFSRDKAQPLPTTSDDPAQRFQVAMQFYGRTEEDIQRITRASRTHAFTWMFILLALTVWAFYQMPFGMQGVSLRHWLFPFFAHLFVVPMTMRSLFWNWQLRTRRLGSWSEFKSNASDWLPGVSTVTKAMLGIVAVSVAYVAGAPQALANMDPSDGVAGVPGVASGALDFLSNADSGKIFYQLLQTLAPVGPIEPGVRLSPWAGPLSNAFGTFNTILLTVSAAMLGWQTVAGMIATAHEGKMLGQRWHQIWAPVRVTAGVGTLVPIAGGFSAIQLVVLQIALWGSGMADVVWNSYIETFRTTNYLTELLDGRNPGERQEYGAAVREIADGGDAQDIALGLLQKQACVAGISQIATQASKLLAAQDPTWDRDVELYSITEAEFDKLYNKMSQIAPQLSAGITYDGAGSSLKYQEMLTGAVSHKIGFNIGGQKIAIGSAPPSSEDTRQVFLMQAAPTISWSFGSCGSLSMDFMDVSALEQKLASSDPTRHQEEAENVWFWQDEGEVDQELVDVDLETHKQAYDLIMASAERVGAAIDDSVLPNTAIAADLLVKAAVGDSDNGIPTQPYKQQLHSFNGPAVQSLAHAYQSYVDIVESERFSVNESIFELTRDRSAFEAYIDKSVEMGWASAGSFYMIIARMQEMNHNLDKITLANSGSWPLASFDAGEDVRETWISITEEYSDFAEKALSITSPRELQENFAWDLNSSQMAGDSALGGVIDNPIVDFIRAWAGKLLDQIGEAFVLLILQMEPDPYFALVDMVEFGQMIVGIAALLFIASIAVSLFFGVGGKVVEALAPKSVDNLVSGIGWLLKMTGIIILAIGVVHAYILPMIPYIMFNFFVVGMLILIAEALVAAPIWAFMHVRMDGQEFVDQVQRPGYMIAFNLFLRPTLAIFGLILSFSVFSASIWFLNATFEIAMRATMAEGSTIVGALVMLLIMTYMHYQLAIRSFKLINELPDRVVRWFGQGGEQLGEADEANRTTALFVGQAEDRMQKAGAGFQADKDGAKAPGDTPTDTNPSGGSKPKPNGDLK